MERYRRDFQIQKTELFPKQQKFDIPWDMKAKHFNSGVIFK